MIRLIIFIAILNTTLYAQTKEYYDNGAIKSIGSFDENELKTGVWKYYHKAYQRLKYDTINAKQSVKSLASIGEYKNGNHHGLWKYYHITGALASIGEYSYKGKTGEWRSYHINGKLKSIGKYLNGEKIGVWNYFDKKGQLVKEEEY